jgi:hypothetical protein
MTYFNFLFYFIYTLYTTLPPLNVQSGVQTILPPLNLQSALGVGDGVGVGVGIPTIAKQSSTSHDAPCAGIPTILIYVVVVYNPVCGCVVVNPVTINPPLLKSNQVTPLYPGSGPGKQFVQVVTPLTVVVLKH